MSAGYRARELQVSSSRQPIFDFCFYKICVQKQWGHQALWSWLRTPTLVVRVQLRLGWYTNLLSKSDVLNFVWKADKVKAGSTILLFFLQPSSVSEGCWGWAESGANWNWACSFLVFSHIGSTEFRSVREVSRYSAFIDNCLIISHTR